MRYTACGRLGRHFLFSLLNHCLGCWGEGRPLLGPRGTPPGSSRQPLCRVHGRRSVNTCGLTNRPTSSAGPFCFRSPRPRTPQASTLPAPLTSQPSRHLPGGPGRHWLHGQVRPLGSATAPPRPRRNFRSRSPNLGRGWAGPGRGRSHEHTWAHKAGQVRRPHGHWPATAPSPAPPFRQPRIFGLPNLGVVPLVCDKGDLGADLGSPPETGLKWQDAT